ncbi:glycosyltransferase [Gryllotalpicola daejeonensis]|uniref:glycosyltransferase n=1 Tax=Gryllotalpicola daejeonensis TaxID=993087 RepID=UPI0031D12535
MRIAHVVTYVSEDGAFGGPVAVAVAQTAELARRGHQVELLAGWDGKAQLAVPGVAVRLFPVSALPVGGFSGLRAPELARRLLPRAGSLDAVHLHLARDLITLPLAARLARSGRPFIVQPHGMVMPDARPKTRLFDAVWTKRTLRAASTAFALTDREEAGLAAVGGDGVRVERIANGIDARPTADAARDAAHPEVLFLARLHPRKRVMAFARAAALLAERGSPARFTVVGPDEGDLAELQRFIAEHPAVPLRYEGAISQGAARGRIAQASVYVLPSFGEVFPMTVLEALSAGTPVVLTSDCGIADELAQRGAGHVTDGSPGELADAVSALLSDASAWSAAVAAGSASITEVFGIGAVADRLEAAYADAGARVALAVR